MATNINSAAELAVLLTVRWGGKRDGLQAEQRWLQLDNWVVLACGQATSGMPDACIQHVLWCFFCPLHPPARPTQPMNHASPTSPPLPQAGVILLSMLGVNVSALLLPAGIAAAVAAKDLSHNFLAGAFLMIVQPFRCHGLRKRTGVFDGV